MKFTSRYIEVPIELINKETADMIGNENVDCEPAKAKVNPFDISFYHETPDSSGVFNRTTLYFKSGQSLLAIVQVHDFEVLLNSFIK